VLRLDAATPGPSDGTKLWGDGFEIETLIHVRVALAGLRVAEVPSYEYPRLHGMSNLRTARDGMRIIRTMAAEWRGRQPSAPQLVTLPRQGGPVTSSGQRYAAPEGESVR
jgi:hypothetical protein